MAVLASTNVIDLTPHLERRARSGGGHSAPSRGLLSAVIPLPLGRGPRNLPPLPPAA